MEFEWDEAKSATNVRKHGFGFDVARRAFEDPLFISDEDRTSIGEQRFSCIGYAGGQLIHVAYTLRGEKIRIVSARKAEPHERRNYHSL